MKRVARLVQEAIAQGKRDYAAFDAERYARLALTSGMQLGKAVLASQGDADSEPDSEPDSGDSDNVESNGEARVGGPDSAGVTTRSVQEELIAGYLRLLAEALVSGYLDQSFFHHVWVEHVPATLGDLVPPVQLPALAKAWNLCEGLAREPEWLGEYVNAQARTEAIGPLDQLDRFVARVLEPALQPVQATSLAPPFRVSVLDPRPQDDELVPDELVLCAPHVVGIKDLRRQSYVALLYRQRGESHFFGPLHSVTEFREASPAPAIAIDNGSVTIADHQVELPRIGQVRSYLAARAGFVVVTAHDSQRVWLIESSA